MNRKEYIKDLHRKFKAQEPIDCFDGACTIIRVSEGFDAVENNYTHIFYLSNGEHIKVSSNDEDLI